MRKIFTKQVVRIISIFLLLSFVIDFVTPIAAFALTSGPSAPEISSFQPAGTSEMVDMFTGDFSYNIPLFELPGPNGGYPFNLSYSDGITMDQEASWVGLGWSLNPGAINRELRGLPDDFNSDSIKVTEDMKSNWTIEAQAKKGWEVFGVKPQVFNALGNVEAGEKPGKIGGSLSINYNSYNGFGYSFGVGLRDQNQLSNGLTMGLALDLTSDTHDGVGINPSVSLDGKLKSQKNRQEEISLGIGYNSKRGLTDINFTASTSRSKNNLNRGINKYNLKPKTANKNWSSEPFRAGLSFTATSFSPSMQQEMEGGNGTFSFKWGAAVAGSYLNWDITGNFSLQQLKHKNKEVDIPTYGYNNLQYGEINDPAKNHLMDGTREKDGMITARTPTIAAPSLSYDVYSISGQGIGGSFRSYRSDIGSMYDNNIESIYEGAGLGLELAPPILGGKLGWDMSVNFTSSANRKLRTTNDSLRFTGTDRQFTSDDAVDYNVEDLGYEPYYYRMYGESTSEPKEKYTQWFKDDDLIQLKLDGTDFEDKFEHDVNTDGDFNIINNTEKLSEELGSGGLVNNSKRKPRANVIQQYTNKELLKIDGENTTETILPEFDVTYYNLPSSYGDDFDVSQDEPTSQMFQRKYTHSENQHKNDHIGGFSVLNTSGMRYIYGLPVYNNTQIDKIFTADAQGIGASDLIPYDRYNDPDDHNVPNSDEYLKTTVTPAYTTAHLLTSVLGADYIDVTNNGPSDDDFGYWVKFNYVKTTTPEQPFKWRVPFEGANHIEGYKSKATDDKGSYIYGEREMYYLASVETKSHIAVFVIEPRHDAFGANCELQDQTSKIGQKSYLLKEIKLFSKMEYYESDGTTINTDAIPISTVHFEYDYHLCPDVVNSDNEGGKLTLTKLYFTYENSTRGELNAYEFTYDSKNYHYDRLAQDRWGNHKLYNTSTDANDCYDANYVEQDPDEDYPNFGNWALKSILTPSGANINIKYEEDDYAFVQNRVATQMTQITGFGNPEARAELYASGNPDKWSDIRDNTMVRFKLEKEIAEGDEEQIDEYFKDLNTVKDGNSYYKQIYFKTLLKMRSSDETPREFISGYSLIDKKNDGSDDYGLCEDSEVGSNYTEGYVRLKPTKVAGSDHRIIKGHPISVAAWQYLRTNLNDIATYPAKITTPEGTPESGTEKAKELMENFTQIMDVFTNYYEQCFRHDWGQQVELEDSYIRLNTPDLKKLGGGSRVGQITIEDSWTHGSEETSEYGVVYDYTTTEKNSHGDFVTASSGVAQYEPILGGDEIALRNAEFYPENILLKTDNNLYFEYPINESLFPAPIVGYSKVTVKSLATDREMRDLSSSDPEYVPPVAFGTGVSVNEFYTAKDFPVITEKTLIRDEDRHHVKGLTIPLLIGTYTKSSLRVTQGFKIELNDMHGKPKSVTYYEQDKNGNINYEQPISSVKYNYGQDSYSFLKDSYSPSNPQTEIVQRLSNEFRVLTGDKQVETREIGVEYEVVTDLRAAKTHSYRGGFDPNVEGIPILALLVPIPVPLPSLGKSDLIVETAAVNKIVHRTGILKSIEAFDGTSKVITENEYFDGYTGRVLISSVTNGFEDKIYSYNLPANWNYDNMGPAYKNIGVDANQNDISIAHLSGTEYTIANSASDFTDYLVPGDRLMVDAFIVNATDPDVRDESKYMATVLDVSHTTDEATVIFDNAVASGIIDDETNLYVKVMRSGRKNLLGADMGNVTALKNPLIRDGQTFCSLDGSSSPSPVIVYKFTDCFEAVFDVFNTRPLTFTSGGYIDITPHGLCPSAEGAYGFRILDDVIRYGTEFGGQGCTINFYREADFSGAISPLDVAIFDVSTLEPISHVADVTGTINARLVGETSYHPVYFKITGAGCDIPIEEITTYLYEGSSCDGIVVDQLDNVLSASATIYSDCWPIEEKDVPTSIKTTDKIEYSQYSDPYSLGEKGLWRPREQYIYNTQFVTGQPNRNQDDNIKLSSDGVFDNMPFFVWDNPLFFSCDESHNWVRTNKITRVNSNSYETENLNALNLPSSALYSYKDMLSVGVASNAGKNEIGFEGFEEYQDGDDVNQLGNSNGNLDLVTSYVNHTNEFIRKQFVIKKSIGNNVVLDGDASAYLPSGTIVRIEGHAPKDGSYLAEDALKTYAVSTISADVDGNTTFTLSGSLFAENPSERCWTGTAYILKTISASESSVSHVSMTNSRAHTGTMCMKISGTGDGGVDATFKQCSLILEPEKKYVFSGWVSLEDMVSPSFNSASAQLICHPTTGGNTTVTLHPSGEVIDGWQRVEGEFTTPSLMDYLSIKLSTGASGTAYFDDIKIYPFDGNMQTYVYDPVNYKVIAVLDDNNYGTLYSYDEQGDLFLVKRETQKGWVTMKESRKYIKQN